MIISSNDNVAYYNGEQYSSFQKLDNIGIMHGARRVIIFCIMTTVLPTVLIIIPLYLRHIVFADVTYTVAESDVVEVTEGMSTVFCASHSLHMNSTFNAFQLDETPVINTKRKHVRLKKSMTLPDDTLEYWGFYLLKGASVYLKVCSRYEGSRILVVRGERNLRTCGLMEHNYNKFGATYDEEHNQVKVTFESAEEIEDDHSSEENVPNLKFANINAAIEDTSVDDVLNSSITNSSTNNNLTSFNNSREIKTKFQKSPMKKYNRRHEKHNLNKLRHRNKRDTTGYLYDTKIEHGGNALNYSKSASDENSVSSFESNLITCYDGQILLAEGFPPSQLCTDVHYLEKGERMETIHDVLSDGYYYYIFYSDNDFISNDIHALFDIYKPTLQFANITTNKSCINNTECSFPITFWSDETVVVEVPMRDGIEHKGDDITYLLSTCHPRMSVYIIFPITIMFLILGCAFM